MHLSRRHLAALATLFLVAAFATRALADTATLQPAMTQTLSAFANAFPGVTSALIVCVLSTLASLICAVTPTPSPGSRWSGLYELVEAFAMVTRTTKLTGIPAIDALHGTAVNLLETKPPTQPAAPKG